MDIITIKTVLESYLPTVSDESEKIKILNSLVEIDEQLSLYRCPDIWKNNIYILTPNSISDLLIQLTYDDFGRLKKSTGSVSLEQYSEIIRKKYYFYELTSSCIELGYHIISDLWSDNEEFGHNNPDGSFCTD
jgi:hypothetical protein